MLVCVNIVVLLLQISVAGSILSAKSHKSGESRSRLYYESYKFESIPASEWTALRQIYVDNGGAEWNWGANHSITLQKWNFTNGITQHNPCHDKWLGIECSCLLTSVLHPFATDGKDLEHVYYDDAFDSSTNSSIIYNASLSAHVACTIIKLHLVGFGVRGKLSSAITSLTNLTHLHLDHNYLSGDLSMISPVSLPSLQSFTCKNNFLKGSFPAFLINSLTITTVDLSRNYIAGSLPNSLKSSSLRRLVLYDNFFTGTLSKKFFVGSCRLQILHIAQNLFQGSLPASINNCTSLETLDVSNNLFQGEFTYNVLVFPSIRYISVASNQFTGGFFTKWGNLCAQNVTRLYPLLQFVNISTNLFDGEVAWGVISKYLPKLATLDASKNHFTGSLNPQLCQCTSIVNLKFAENFLTRRLPDCLANLKSLSELDLSRNKLYGTISIALLKAPALKKLHLGHNLFTGTIPNTETRNISRKLFMLQLNNNFFTGKISYSWLHNTNLKVLTLNNNYFSDFAKDIPITRANTSLVLEVLDISTNLLQGDFPGEQFFAILPNLHTLFAVHNCFSIGDGDLNHLLTTFCDHTQALSVLSLDGMSSACKVSINSQLVEELHFNNVKKRSLPSCLFTSLPQLTTLSLSGVNLLGSLPGNISVLVPDEQQRLNESKLKTLILSHNMLTGSIPEAFQYISWTELDLSYNKLSGILNKEADFAFVSTPNNSAGNANANAELYFQANRLSGNIPAVYQRTLKHLSILNGNLFTCKYDRTDLPQNDPISSIYSCGTNGINILILIWVGFYFFGTLLHLVNGMIAQHSWTKIFQAIHLEKVLLFSHQRHLGLQAAVVIERNTPRQGEMLKEEREKDYKQLSPVLFAFLQGMHYLYSFLFWYGVYLLVFVMVIYGVLGKYYKSHEVTYAYILSGGFFSGIIPGVILYGTWLLGLVLLVKISYHFSDIHTKADGKTTFHELEAAKRQINWRNKDVKCVMLMIVVSIIFFVVVIILLNIAFLYALMTLSVYYQFFAQCIMSCCKILLRKVIIPAVFSSIFGQVLEVELWKKVDKPKSFGRKKSQVNVPNEHVHVALVEEKEEMHAKKAWCYFYQLTIEVIFSIFVTILAPGVATAIFDINCFYYVSLSKPPTVSSAYTFQYCTSYSASTKECENYAMIEHDASYQPSYEYTCQCASVLLSNYLFVFIFMLILDEFVKPVVRNIYIHRYEFVKYPIDFVKRISIKQFQQVQPASKTKSVEPIKKLQYMHDFISSSNFGKNRFAMDKKEDIVLQLEEKPFLLLLLNYLSILFTFGLMFPPLGIMICVFLSRNLFKVFHVVEEFFEEILHPKFLFPLPPFCRELLTELRMDQSFSSKKQIKAETDKHHREMLIKAVIISSEKRIQYCLLLVMHLLFWVLIPLNISYMHHFTFDSIADSVGLRYTIIAVAVGFFLTCSGTFLIGKTVIVKEKISDEDKDLKEEEGVLQRMARKSLIRTKDVIVKATQQQQPVVESQENIHDINVHYTNESEKEKQSQKEFDEHHHDEDDEDLDDFMDKKTDRRGSNAVVPFDDEENQMKMRRTPSRKVSVTRRPAMITKHLDFTPEVAGMVESVELQNLVEEFVDI